MKPIKKTVKVNPPRLSVCAPEKVEYEKDFYKWTQDQAKILKKAKNLKAPDFSKLDIDNLIEEIESLGKNDKRVLRSQLVKLLMHLLKQKYQPEKQIDSNSWHNSIIDATRELRYLIKDSPSLRNELNKIYLEAYEDAKEDAATETKLDIKKFPKECPWKIEEILPFSKKKKL